MSGNSSDSEYQEISISYGSPLGDPTAGVERYKVTSTHFGDTKYSEKLEKVGKKKYKNERTDTYYYSKERHCYKEKGVNVEKPKSVKKAMKPTNMDVASGLVGIWSSTSDKIAEMDVAGFKDSTVNTYKAVAAAEAHTTTKTKDSNPFEPSASATASAAKAGASCGASGTGLYAYAGARASGAEASAKAALVDGIIEVGANAEAASAQASANVSVLGAHAGADAKVAGASAGLAHTPLQAGASVLGAGAETGVGWKYTGASAGAHVAEARAGPFGIRAGVKFGAGIRNGVPEVDLGPVTVPCCVM